MQYRYLECERIIDFSLIDIYGLYNKEIITSCSSDQLHILESIIPEEICDQFILKLFKVPPQSITNKTRDGYILQSPRYEEEIFLLLQQLNISIQDFKITRFNKGGYFAIHSDNEIYHNDEWVKINNKEFTIMIFLNDDYVGGEIIFPNQNITFKPKKGLIITFPSNHEYIYGMQPIIQGTAITIIGFKK